jgi:hypothetical protein
VLGPLVLQWIKNRWGDSGQDSQSEPIPTPTI